MKIFFDSSALAKRYIEEMGSEKVQELCSEATLIGVSSICLPEIVSALCRLHYHSSITNEQYREAKEALLKDFEDILVCNITPAVISQAVSILETNRVRTLDALHIACALEWKAEAFATSDVRQSSAARRAGLRIVTV
jgi:predicted nucleic acid-binding protein